MSVWQARNDSKFQATQNYSDVSDIPTSVPSSKNIFYQKISNFSNLGRAIPDGSTIPIPQFSRLE